MDKNTILPDAEGIKLLAQLGVDGTKPEIVNISTDGLGDALPKAVPVLWDRNGQKASSVRSLIEEYRERPQRRKGTAKAQTLKAFIDLVSRHQDEDSAIFADLNWRAPSFTAVIDYHRSGETTEERHEPRNLGHRISYAFPLSEEWQAWVAANGKPMSQSDFAAFVEDHIADLAAATKDEEADIGLKFQTAVADPHEVMQLSRGLQISVDSKVKQVRSLQSGEAEVLFEEVHRDGSGQKLVIPGMFMLSLPVFFRGANVRVPVRLRYRVKDGAITWAFQMWRPDVHVTEAVKRDLDAVEVETGLPTFEGSPEA